MILNITPKLIIGELLHNQHLVTAAARIPQTAAPEHLKQKGCRAETRRANQVQFACFSFSQSLKRTDPLLKLKSEWLVISNKPSFFGRQRRQYVSASFSCVRNDGTFLGRITQHSYNSKCWISTVAVLNFSSARAWPPLSISSQVWPRKSEHEPGRNIKASTLMLKETIHYSSYSWKDHKILFFLSLHFGRLI